MGSLLTMATTGPLDVDYRNYGSAYSRETASPGYYSDFLDKYGILAEVSATLRSGGSATPSRPARATSCSTWARV